jgi:FSR family fosmidomycin resistance protein-like MFS transporter
MDRVIKIFLLSIGHLVIDLSGIYLINVQYNDYDFSLIVLFFLVYNLIAFGLQPFVGFYADVKNKYFMFVLLGLFLPVVGLLLIDFGIIAIVILTIGNALYHVGGGVISVNLYPNKATPAGVFVAPGAIGVFLGVYLAGKSMSFIPIIITISSILILLIYIVFKHSIIENNHKDISNNFTLIVGLILVVIGIRGFIGSILLFTWADTLTYQILLVSSIFLGKFFGGILGDKFGFKETGIFGLIVSMPLLLLGYSMPILGLIGALFFNFTMAITLFLIIDNLGRYKGFAFGLTTLTLVITFLPKSFGFSFNIGIVYYMVVMLLAILGSYILFKIVSLYDINNKMVEE